MSNSSELDYEQDECTYEPQIFLPWKMCFVGCFGLITALVSVFHNCLLFYTFNRSKVLRKRNLTYLMWISGCDIFVSISYIAIMCVQVYIDFFESLTLFYLWHRCLRAAFTVSHITFSSSSFLLMAATIERYLQSTQDGRAEHLFRILVRNRGSVVLLCFAASCIFRGTVFFEVAVLHNPHCTGFSSMGLAVARIFTNPVHDAIWRFWIRKIVTVFLPFAVLAWFNAAIVFSVQKTDRDQTVKALVLFTTVGSRAEITRLRSRLRAVTRMLVMVVCCYLASNIIDVVIAFWETIDITSLYAYRGFYTVTTDISSFLPILACALRLPIYAANDKQIRTEVSGQMRDIFGRLCGFCPGIGHSMRLAKKFHNGAEIENEKLVINGARTKSSLDGNLERAEYATTGIAVLIMARCKLASLDQRPDVENFQEIVKV